MGALLLGLLAPKAIVAVFAAPLTVLAGALVSVMPMGQAWFFLAAMIEAN